MTSDLAHGHDYDLIAIGGGSGGIATANRAALNGARCLLIERDERLGGTCVNRGCVPKKLMWHSAHERREAQGLAQSGLIDEPSTLAYGLLHERIGTKVRTIRDSFETAMRERGIEIVRGRAELRADGSVRVGERDLHAPKLVLASGSEPTALDIPGWEHCGTSDDVFGWTECPGRLLIVGGGYIGVELATVFSGLGSDVVIADESDHLLGGFDPDAVALAESHLSMQGVEHVPEVQLQSVRLSASGREATLSNGTVAEYDRIVVAIGRTPRIEGLGPIGGDLATVANGALKISDTFETSRSGIYAVGDVADRLPLTPVARRDGEWLAHYLFGEDPGPRLDLDLVATATYCDPPIAQIGVTDADDHDLDVESDRLDPLRNGLFRHERDGMTYMHKLVTDGGRLRGVVLVSRTSPDEISYAATLVAIGADRSALRRPGSVHPTFAEEFIG